MADGTSERLRALYAQRRDKADRLRAQDRDPYPARTRGRRRSISAARQACERWERGERQQQPSARLAGRITGIRNLGQLAFIDLRDGSGAIQLLCHPDALGKDRLVFDSLDLGDFVEAQGKLARSRTGELSLEIRSLQMLAKALRPPPEKFHGLQDVEARYRQRYLDLQTNTASREVFVLRSKIIAALRRLLDRRGFMEVETPVLQAEAGGAAARPFTTYFHALDEERHLRIATELHLKRLIVGGLEKVYEVGRIFRNEGVSTLHHPEFTMLESYEAYADYQAVAAMVEELVAALAQEVLGTTRIPCGEHQIDLTPPWRRLTIQEAVEERTGIDIREQRTPEALAAILERQGISPPEGAGWGKMLEALVTQLVEPTLIQPTFLMDYPVEISPLAKRTTYDPQLVERFEGFIAGSEIANAYSELNDPLEQRDRFRRQRQLRAAGDEEAELADEDFLVALEHGMPPTGGLGMGIDRLVMVLTNSRSIRDVILFPQLRRSRPQPGRD